MHSSKDIDLLLIGKTGNGKSALGNTILRRKAFQSKSSQNSVTKNVDYDVSEFRNRVIKVVDGPGVGDTRMDNEESLNLVTRAMEFAITANPRGYHAFLLVAKFGGRFTAEDQDTVQFLKQIFGEQFVRNFCILVLTCGDCFDSDDPNMTFQEWCNEQTGVFKELLEECCHRVLLFDNRTKDEAKREKQLLDLIEMVDNLRWRDLHYTDENFQKAREAREKMLVEAKEPMLREETMNEISLIIQKLNWTQENVEPEEGLSYLEDLQQRIEKLYDSILIEDNETGALHSIIQTVNSIKITIEDEIKILQRVIKERSKMGEIKDLREREFQKTLEEERQRKQRQIDEIYSQFKTLKEEKQTGFFRKIVDSIKMPFKKIFTLK